MFRLTDRNLSGYATRDGGMFGRFMAAQSLGRVHAARVHGNRANVQLGLQIVPRQRIQKQRATRGTSG